MSRPVVLITGAFRRLGRHLALHLARAGYDLALHGRRLPDPDADTLRAELQSLGACCALLAANLSVEAEVEALVPAALAELGRLDGVVNSASRFEHDDAASFSMAEFDAHMHANAAAPLLLSRALYRHCLASERKGCVVHLLDQKLWNPNPDHLSYTLSKAALAATTPLLAQCFAPTLRVVGVAPGLTLTSRDIDASQLAALQAATLLQKGVDPDHIAQAVLFALSNASVTGSHILVDAGSHLQRQPRDFPFLHQHD